MDTEADNKTQESPEEEQELSIEEKIFKKLEHLEYKVDCTARSLCKVIEALQVITQELELELPPGIEDIDLTYFNQLDPLVPYN